MCEPKIIPASVHDYGHTFANLIPMLSSDLATALSTVRETQSTNRWSPRQTLHAVILQLAGGIVRTELKPGKDGWFKPKEILSAVETLFDRPRLQEMFNTLKGTSAGWSEALLAAVELLCVTWNISGSFVSCSSHASIHAAVTTILQA
eukprot:SAG31_NODE_7712_length_1611_cov_1.023148_1_plen_148_part_00